MEFYECIPLRLAQQQIREAVDTFVPRREIVPLEQALGRVTVEDIRAREDLPSFSRSTVDGFALASADTYGAGEGAPAMLTVNGEVAMGQVPREKIIPGQATAIPTGAMLPAGADAVLMLEYTEQPDAETLLAVRAVAPGENVIRQGEDVAQGGCVVAAGQKLGPRDIGLLAGCGCTEIEVVTQTRVSIISTGDELVDIRAPLTAGQIRDVNSHAIGALLATAGCQVRTLGIVRDDFLQFAALLSAAVQDCDLVIISGGSSVGARDYTVRSIEAQTGGTVCFHGVAIKPGRPTIFGMVGSVPVFGLPGHPAAAMTVCEQLVVPALRQLTGQIIGREFGLIARLLRNVASTPGRDDFIPVRLVADGDGYAAEPMLGKSGLISPQAQAEGILHIAAEKSGLYKNDLVQIQLIKGGW